MNSKVENGLRLKRSNSIKETSKYGAVNGLSKTASGSNLRETAKPLKPVDSAKNRLQHVIKKTIKPVTVQPAKPAVLPSKFKPKTTSTNDAADAKKVVVGKTAPSKPTGYVKPSIFDKKARPPLSTRTTPLSKPSVTQTPNQVIS